MELDLINAVLSMDSYNRNYNVGLLIPGDNLGIYTFLPIGLPEDSEQISFSASAYLTNDGSTIISYRGTDNLSSDLWNYGIGAGQPFTSQFFAAFEFYNSVVTYLQERAALPESNIDPNAISLTGHSLGGGLAGLVAAIKGKNAELFANMPFEAAVANAYGYILAADLPFDPYGPYSDPILYALAGPAKDLIYGSAGVQAPQISTNLHGYAVEWEFLAAARNLRA